jgi:hypothetical protein
VTSARRYAVAILITSVVALSGCAPITHNAAYPPVSMPPASVPTVEPKTYDGVMAAMDRMEQAIATHDWGTLWDQLTSTGQAAMTRDDYITVITGCPKIVALPQVTSITLAAANTTATVTVTAPAAQGGTYTFVMVYEAGHWKHQPSDGAMTWMGLGADKALAALRNNGSC